MREKRRSRFLSSNNGGDEGEGKGVWSLNQSCSRSAVESPVTRLESMGPTFEEGEENELENDESSHLRERSSRGARYRIGGGVVGGRSGSRKEVAAAEHESLPLREERDESVSSQLRKENHNSR
ncbi:hypothetical protein NL676_029327 [Syzygium grande]|nr:hypothetical protein NL676_029327 [Syzygium grande]